MAEFLSDVPVDVIYSSDLKRAYSTAVHTAEKKKLEIIKTLGLREIYAGEWEGMLFDDIEREFKESYGIWLTNIGNAVCDGGESVAELRQRVVSEMKKIAEENTGKTIFVFTHATVIRVFKNYCDGNGIDKMKEVPWAPNASVTKVEYSDEGFVVIEYGNDSFQGEFSSTVPANV